MIEVWAFWMIVSCCDGRATARMTVAGFPSEVDCEEVRHGFVDLQVHPREGELDVRDVKPCKRR